MINAISATNYDVVLVDLFFEETEFTISEINQLKIKANGGQRLVISYINIGSAEKFRYYWKKNWGLQHPLWLISSPFKQQDSQHYFSHPAILDFLQSLPNDSDIFPIFGIN